MLLKILYSLIDQTSCNPLCLFVWKEDIQESIIKIYLYYYTIEKILVTRDTQSLVVCRWKHWFQKSANSIIMHIINETQRISKSKLLDNPSEKGIVF